MQNKNNESTFVVACLTIFVAALISSEANAQTTAIFHLKDSTTQQAEILANSMDAIYITGGFIKLKNISRVELSNDKYKDYFLKNNIPVSINVGIAPVSPIAISQIATKEDLDQLYESLDRFRFQRSSGKVLQLVGVLLVAGSAVVASQEDPNTDLVGGLAIGGAVISTTGFIIDLNAGKQLRKRDKR